MSYNVTRLRNEPIVIATLNEDYDIHTEIFHSNTEAAQLLDEYDDPSFLIVHLVVHLDVAGVSVGANETSRGNDPLFHHPKLREVLLVSTDDVIHMAAEGLTTELYGNVPAKAFYDMDEALAYARANS